MSKEMEALTDPTQQQARVLGAAAGQSSGSRGRVFGLQGGWG
jgi:hypothetical protein